MKRLAVALTAAAALVAAGAAARADAVPVVPDGGFVVQGSTSEVKRQIDIAHDAGARWVSIAARWQELEPSEDLSSTAADNAWADLTDRLSYAKSRSMNIELRLSDAPAWASGREAFDDPPTPGHVADYAAFLSRLGARVGALVDAYSPWNEPNRPALWNPPDPDRFTALQMAAYPAIKAADPTATVIYGPVVGRYAGVNSGYAFLRRSYELGAKGSFDVIGWNGYPGGPPESSAPVENGAPAGNTLPAQIYLRDLIDNYDPGRKVWIMEFGWSTCAGCNVSAANGVSEAQQADYLTRAFEYRRRYLAQFVDRMFWYEMQDRGTNRSVWDENEGVIRRDFSAKPALSAFAALAVEDADGLLPPQAGGPTLAPHPALPSAATRLALPTTARSGRTRRTSLGRATIHRARGVFTLRVRIAVSGGSARVRFDGYRTKRWRALVGTVVRRSGVITVRVRDKGYVGFRVRATVPGLRGWRVGRVVPVPKRLLQTP